jgi:hypothetical protein
MFAATNALYTELRNLQKNPGFSEARAAVIEDAKEERLAAWHASDFAYQHFNANRLQDSPIVSIGFHTLIRLHLLRNLDPRETNTEEPAQVRLKAIHRRDSINAYLERKKARKIALQKIEEEQKKAWEEHERKARRGCDEQTSRFNPY